jgi:hypothetical protein
MSNHIKEVVQAQKAEVAISNAIKIPNVTDIDKTNLENRGCITSPASFVEQLLVHFLAEE